MYMCLFVFNTFCAIREARAQIQMLSFTVGNASHVSFNNQDNLPQTCSQAIMFTQFLTEELKIILDCIKLTLKTNHHF